MLEQLDPFIYFTYHKRLFLILKIIQIASLIILKAEERRSIELVVLALKFGQFTPQEKTVNASCKLNLLQIGVAKASMQTGFGPRFLHGLPTKI